MARNLDKILVVDLEATCWEGNPPRGEKQEIIEIGVVLLNMRTFERENKTSWFVRPRFSRVSQFCTDLTTITQLDVDGGISLQQACDKLQYDFDSRNRTWASFGDFDRNLFERECRDKAIRYPFCSTHINIKNLLALMMGWDREKGTEQVLRELEHPLEGTHHRAGDDAWNVAFVLSKILRRGMIDNAGNIL